MKEQIEEIACEKCLHHLACLTNSEYVPTPCPAYEDKAGYRKQEWISVEERLPKQWESVLVFCGDEDEIGTDFIASNGRWYEHIHDTVTHWMPLPEPPKMKGGAE